MKYAFSDHVQVPDVQRQRDAQARKDALRDSLDKTIASIPQPEPATCASCAVVAAADPHHLQCHVDEDTNTLICTTTWTRA